MLDLVIANEGFALSQTRPDGSSTTIMLSEQELTVLAQSAQRVLAVIEARQSQSGAAAVVVTPLGNFGTEMDVQRREMFLTLTDQHDFRMTYSMARHTAVHLAQKILAEIEKAVKAPVAH